MQIHTHRLGLHVRFDYAEQKILLEVMACGTNTKCILLEEEMYEIQKQKGVIIIVS